MFANCFGFSPVIPPAQGFYQRSFHAPLLYAFKGGGDLFIISLAFLRRPHYKFSLGLQETGAEKLRPNFSQLMIGWLEEEEELARN